MAVILILAAVAISKRIYWKKEAAKKSNAFVFGQGVDLNDDDRLLTPRRFVVRLDEDQEDPYDDPNSNNEGDEIPGVNCIVDVIFNSNLDEFKDYVEDDIFGETSKFPPPKLKQQR